MNNKNTLSFQLSEKVRNMANNNYGLGRIFNHLRKLEFCRNLNDLQILRLTLAELSSLGKLPSKEKIKHHFRTKISRDDYEGASKREILKDLYNPTH